ncbi:MAG: sigma-70 family RNA polymerase sigma factor [Bryobacteraceae bacterium]|nr:sigma-70 family RNA polymerase sigma factor [Bryobacteraceae bacterium]
MSGVQTTVVSDREQTILSHMPQVRLLAFRTYQRCPSEVELDDLVSAGTLGLIQALDRYEPGRGLKMNTFAEHRIRGAILDYLRALDPLPRAARHFQRQREEAQSLLESRLERPPSEAETAVEMSCSLTRYRKLAVVVRAASVVSLDLPNEKSGRPLQIAASESGEAPVDDHLLPRLRDAITRLPRRERLIVHAIQRGQTLRQIAKRLRMSESRASQLKSLAIVRLRLAFGLSGESA